MPFVPELSRFIPLNARTILDAGCGTGMLGAALRRLNPNARLFAIDKDPAMIAAARAHYDEAAAADLEAGPPPFDVPGGFDCIVFMAVLEQLIDPFAVLRAYAERLHPDGTMILCVSNVRHWSLTERLLRGTFGYEDHGLLDRRHLRWFSPESMTRGLSECGLIPVNVQGRIFDEPQGRTFLSRIGPALDALGIGRDGYESAALPLQHVWRVRKTPARRMIVAANMLDPVGGVSHVRVVHPMTALGTDPSISVRVINGPLPPEVIPLPPEIAADPDAARIFILHRPAYAGPAGQSVINRVIEQGWLVVTEFDDHPDFLRPMRRPEVVTFSGVHAVQTTTPMLGAVLRQRNPETAVFPNGIDVLPEVRNFSHPAVLTVFFGALNREADWAPIMDAINDVAARLPGRLRFEVVHDQGFFDALRAPDKHFHPLCDHSTYLDILGRSEISLMPLNDTPFNRAKSDLKFIEAGACRAAALASRVVYGDSIVEGETGLLFDDPDSFHHQFLRLAAVPDLALSLGAAARRMVTRQRMLADQIAPRIAWYRSLWARRVELTEVLCRRIEGLPLPRAPW